MKTENRKRWARAWTASLVFHGLFFLGLAAAAPFLLPDIVPPVIEVDLLAGSAGGGAGGQSGAPSAPAGSQALLTVRGSEGNELLAAENADTESLAAAAEEESAGRAAGSGESMGTGTGAGFGEGSGPGRGDGQGAGTGQGGESAIEPPRLLSAPDSVYPESARRRGAEGTVTVGLRIEADGSVAETWVERSSGDSELDEAACEAVRRWRFAPARQNGAPAAARSRVPVVFTLHG